MNAWPMILQGGMGVGISNWRLAQTVSRAGQLGIVSGTAMDTLLVRRLQDGDPGGHMRRSMARFPIPGIAAEVLKRYYRPEGLPAGTKYALLPMFTQRVSAARKEIAVLASFIEVDLAREGHSGPIGVNLLTKVQFPNLALLYGAMLAGVGYVVMGAGIPREIPAVLDAFATHQPAALKLEVEDLPSDRTEEITFDPQQHWHGITLPPLQRPRFLAVIASNLLATVLARKASGKVDGFVVEGPTAGGHNAPPRGAPVLNAKGEPVYGPRDEVDLAKLAELGLPFWVAGGVGSPEGLAAAIKAGAAGIQVGTLFAYCEESGLAPEFKRSILAAVTRNEVEVLTDPRASPTGYPFKVVQWPGDPTAGVAEPRERLCDLGYLRSTYVREDGRIGYRCSAEPVEDYVAKGGKAEDTVGRRCLCNALLADVGHPQARGKGRVEPPLVTSGDDLVSLGRFLGERTTYGAKDVLDYLLGGVAQA
ncbi:MAG: nitronate monooxygenase [Gemmatimonadales bacterium]